MSSASCWVSWKKNLMQWMQPWDRCNKKTAIKTGLHTITCHLHTCFCDSGILGVSHRPIYTVDRESLSDLCCETQQLKEWDKIPLTSGTWLMTLQLPPRICWTGTCIIHLFFPHSKYLLHTNNSQTWWIPLYGTIFPWKVAWKGFSYITP